MASGKNRIPALSLLLVMAFQGCGLPTVSYLYPPAEMVVAGNQIISVQNDARNYEASEGLTQTFKGVEIFYRIFESETTASSVRNSLENLSDTYSDEPNTFMDIVKGDTYKFSRLRNYSENRNQPLIPIAADDEDYYYLQLNSYSAWKLTDNASESLFYDSVDISQIIRSLDTSDSNASFYAKDFQTGDDDYEGTTSSTAADYFIVFFAVSYGVDQATVGQTVYSSPNIPSNYVSY